MQIIFNEYIFLYNIYIIIIAITNFSIKDNVVNRWGMI